MPDADVSLLHSGLFVSRSFSDSALLKAPTREYAAVALVKGDHTNFVMIVYSKTVQALDTSLDVPALAGQLPVSQLGPHLRSVLPE